MSGSTPSLYRPPYPGPIDADETILHIMASGASVNATLVDAINNPFFGEREAIKLAYGEDGNRPASRPLRMIDGRRPADRARAAGRARHRPRGRQRRRVFDVTAADVVGYLGLERAGNSLTDFYSFTAQAGTLINFRSCRRVLGPAPRALSTPR